MPNISEIIDSINRRSMAEIIT
nr:RecName: Full=Uncharacterized protein in flaB3 3'region [Methanococcus voltae]